MNIKTCCGCPYGQEIIYCGCDCHKKNPQTIKGTFYFDTWYEIFVTKETGETQTIDSVSNFDEINKRILELEKCNPDLKGRLSADQWGSLDEEGNYSVQI
jgi:hypothetical protein